MDDAVADAALVRDDNEDMLEFDFDRINAGRGGDSESRASRPSLFNCSSFCDVSASEASRSCDKLTNEDPRRMPREPLDETELSDVIEGELSEDLLDCRLREGKSDDDELGLGAETGMTTPVFFNPDLENFGADRLAEKSISGVSGKDSVEGVAGLESAHSPEGDFLIVGRRL